MLIDYGEAALVTTLITTVVQASGVLLLKFKEPLVAYRYTQVSTVFNWVLLSIALIALLYAFATSDFRVTAVALNSQVAEPLFYRITATWGNHEGSMLLWVWILACYQGVFAMTQKHIPLQDRIFFLSIFGFVLLTFIIFILWTSNPFERFLVPAKQGLGLNPILQDPALAIHPPVLYIGYVGFVVPFICALVALLQKCCDARWAMWVQSWTLFAWSFLTLGITLGSWWAYYELGWGGWWFWDPVENVSLLVWFLGTALLHAVRVLQKREAYKAWTILLAILTFAASVMGTLLVRSGMLVSVHSFAKDPKRGLFIAVVLLLLIIPSLILYGIRIRHLNLRQVIPYFSRGGIIAAQNYGMVLMTCILLLTILYPLIVPTVSVSAHFFNITLIPLCLPFLFLMGLSSALSWQSSNLIGIFQRLHWPLMFCLLLILILLYWLPTSKLIAISTLSIAVWILLATVMHYIPRITRFKEHGMPLAHIGFALMLLGMSIDVLFGHNKTVALAIGEQTNFLNYQFRLADIERIKDEVYMAEKGVVQMLKQDKLQTTMYPEKRLYLRQQLLTSEVALSYQGLSQYYVVLGGLQSDERRILTLTYHPFISLIWLGGILMFCGGISSCFKIRFRSRSAMKAKLN